MAKVLVVATSGPEDPTKAVLPFLTARNLKELGHEPALFLAGDSVLHIRDEVVDAVEFPAARPGGSRRQICRGRMPSSRTARR